MQIIKPMLGSAIFMIIAVNVRAQFIRDYIVTLKNDTIYGDLRFVFGVASKLETEQSDIWVDVRHVDSYYSASRQLLARRKFLPGKKRFLFLRCVEHGRINLYETQATTSSFDGTQNSKATFTLYAEKESNQLIEVWTNRGYFGNSNKSQREALAALLADNPRVTQIIDNDKKYELGDSIYYIHEYNKDAAGR